MRIFVADVPYLVGVIILFLRPGVSHAGPFSETHSTIDHKNPIEISSPDRRGIHLRAGVSVRSIGVDFSVSPASSAGGFGLTNSGLGDVGLFTGGVGMVTYEDGTVGGDNGELGGGAANGLAEVTINNPASQVVGVSGPFNIIEAIFTSSETTLGGTVSGIPQSAQFSDDEISVAPFFQLVVPLWEEEDSYSYLSGGKGVAKGVLEEGNRFLNFVIGYSFHWTDHDTGLQPIRTGTVERTDADYSYTYDYVENATAYFPAGNFAIYDAPLALANALDTVILEDPRTAMEVRNSLAAVTIFSQTHLDVDLHEIPIGLEWGRRFGKNRRSTMALNAGGTLNFVNLDLTSRTQYFLSGTSSQVGTSVSRNSVSDVLAGAYVGANYTRFLNDKETVYFEAHGSYRWVDDISVSTTGADADVDLSSWEGGIMIGVVFD